MHCKNDNKGFILFPVLVIAAIVGGVLFMTAPNSVKRDLVDGKPFHEQWHLVKNNQE